MHYDGAGLLIVLDLGFDMIHERVMISLCLCIYCPSIHMSVLPCIAVLRSTGKRPLDGGLGLGLIGILKHPILSVRRMDEQIPAVEHYQEGH